MIDLKSPAEIDKIARAGAVLAGLFRELPGHLVPGATTAGLDQVAESFIRDHDGATPAFKGLYGFPATLCTSVNEEVVHGIPSPRRRLREGDLVSVDCGVRLDGFYADAAVTFPVGEVAREDEQLLQATRRALERGIEEARVGARLGDVSAAIQEVGESSGLGVIRDLVGHGVGKSPHEDPQVPNWGRRGRGMRLPEGLVIAIEPMFNAGLPGIETLADAWTVVTADRRRSAHFEHTVAVTGNGPRILTS
ncbi:MAG: type I methionyl aminopeptidase [Longimicrobiaceae bacterium]